MDNLRTIIPLNGLWDIQPGDSNLPLGQWAARVPVPGLVDLASPGYDWKAHRYHWYRRAFTVESLTRAKRAILHIDQAMFGTEVWLNGKHIGSDISCYTSQEYDLTSELLSDHDNILLVRVGLRDTLPVESAVGNDQERELFIPGIWGDVSLIRCGNPRILHVQAIPHIEIATADLRVTIENTSGEPKSVMVAAQVWEWMSGTAVSAPHSVMAEVPPQSVTTAVLQLPIFKLKLWSVEQPFLYEGVVTVQNDDGTGDEVRARFGMREFRIEGSQFLLNGKRVFLKGGNIAFHRFLSDPDRGRLPWNPDWIRRIFIEIPRANHFNFFRSHIGQMYTRWYDLADEQGMMIQNEWPFWTTTGSKEQIEKEFTRWLQDNWNHPSIVIWDGLNESSDSVVEQEIIPKMKRLDPTRPWEPVDFVEDHPYIYSLGPVLNEERLGFARGFREIEHSKTPSVVNEFLWWWLDSNGAPSRLTLDVLERWLGPSPPPDDVLRHQSFLAAELVELFRRMRVDAIQPFVYLSNNTGPTANWFLGDIKDLNPKPVLKALQNAFAPFGVSVELWDRHFFPSERRTVTVFVFNDESDPRSGTLHCSIHTGKGGADFSKEVPVTVEGLSCQQVSVEFEFPDTPGRCEVRAELLKNGSTELPAHSRKIAHVVQPPLVPENISSARVELLDLKNESARFLKEVGISVGQFGKARSGAPEILLVAEGEVRGSQYQAKLDLVAQLLDAGGSVLVLEPEFGITGKDQVSLTPNLCLSIERRPDTDKGGYDSHVFPTDTGHAVWQGLEPDLFKFFNGGIGGEIVSQHDVNLNRPWNVLARCGLHLGVVALAEVSAGKGKVIISRIQTRGRLLESNQSADLFERRTDPVARQYLLNLIGYARSAPGEPAALHVSARPAES